MSVAPVIGLVMYAMAVSVLFVLMVMNLGWKDGLKCLALIVFIIGWLGIAGYLMSIQ